VKYVAYDIEYDIDEDDINAKEELQKFEEIVIDVPENEEDIEDFIADEISNKSDFCHRRFNYHKIDQG